MNTSYYSMILYDCIIVRTNFTKQQSDTICTVGQLSKYYHEENMNIFRNCGRQGVRGNGLQKCATIVKLNIPGTHSNLKAQVGSTSTASHSPGHIDAGSRHSILSVILLPLCEDKWNVVHLTLNTGPLEPDTLVRFSMVVQQS